MLKQLFIATNLVSAAFGAEGIETCQDAQENKRVPTESRVGSSFLTTKELFLHGNLKYWTNGNIEPTREVFNIPILVEGETYNLKLTLSNTCLSLDSYNDRIYKIKLDIDRGFASFEKLDSYDNAIVVSFDRYGFLNCINPGQPDESLSSFFFRVHPEHFTERTPSNITLVDTLTSNGTPAVQNGVYNFRNSKILKVVQGHRVTLDLKNLTVTDRSLDRSIIHPVQTYSSDTSHSKISVNKD